MHWSICLLCPHEHRMQMLTKLPIFSWHLNLKWLKCISLNVHDSLSFWWKDGRFWKSPQSKIHQDDQTKLCLDLSKIYTDNKARKVFFFNWIKWPLLSEFWQNFGMVGFLIFTLEHTILINFQKKNNSINFT